jgi:hypothetical protein
MEEVLERKGHEWNVDLIAVTYTFDLQKTLNLKKITKNLIEKTSCETVFIPWEKKPILLKRAKPILLLDLRKVSENLLRQIKKVDSKFAFIPWKKKLLIKKVEYKNFENIKRDVKEKKLDEKYKLFIVAIGSEKISFDPRYLTAEKFVRIKLPDRGIQFTSELLNQLGKNVEVHLLIHKTGIIIVTLYIPLSGKTLNTYEIIEIERRLPKEKVKINDGNEKGLGEYLLDKLENLFLTELKDVSISVAVRKLKKRGSEKEARYAMCIRKFKYGIIPYEELYGIVNAMRGWYRLDKSRIELEELYKRRDFYIFVGNFGYLFFGFDEFEKHIDENNKNFEQDPGHYGELHFLYTFPEYFEHYVITPLEFLSIIDSILERYFSKVQDVSGNVSRNYWKSTKLIKEFFECIHEYSNITFISARPIWKIMKGGEENLEIPERIEDAKANVSTLSSAAQQDALIRITIIFAFISIAIGWLSLKAINFLGIIILRVYIPINLLMVVLISVIIIIAGIRVVLFTILNALSSLVVGARELIGDICLFLKTMIDIKFKKHNKKSNLVKK